mmetsp:Transcript_27157/g.78093  ORF Transcript_27157/g.78093 Transcript_27157/m.78093 type:complete len:114 (+) Transcript_27157:478-819(+)
MARLVAVQEHLPGMLDWECVAALGRNGVAIEDGGRLAHQLQEGSSVGPMNRLAGRDAELHGDPVREGHQPHRDGITVHEGSLLLNELRSRGRSCSLMGTPPSCPSCSTPAAGW